MSRFGDIKLDLYDSALEFELNQPAGMVGRHMRKIGLEILSEAKTLTGVRTGNLKRSLHMRQGLRGRVQYVTVGSNLRYAEAHHEGTRPHRIDPQGETEAAPGSLAAGPAGRGCTPGTDCTLVHTHQLARAERTSCNPTAR